MELEGTVARKRGDPTRLSIEAAVTAEAAYLGERTGLFDVPPVERFDAQQGVLETRRIEGFRSLMDLAVTADPRVTGACQRLGAAMARVHRDLIIAEPFRISFPELLASGDSSRCVLHGDLTASNVGIAPGDRLVILDWSAAPSVRLAATIGDPQFDLFWFSTFFFRTRPIAILAGWRPEEWTHAFFTGYARGGGEYDAERLRRYARQVRPFLEADIAVELARRARGVRWLPYRIWRGFGVRRWWRFMQALEDPPAGERAA